MNFDRITHSIVSVALGAGLLASGTIAHAGVVRIVAADGRLAPDGRVQRILVRPGQVVSLAADEVSFEPHGGIEYSRRAPEDFAWQAVGVDSQGRPVAEHGPADRCDPALGCPPDSNFEATPYGVNYYVPWNPPDRIRIRASLKWGPASDVVDLINEESAGADGRAEPMTERPAWERELDGLGYWVRVADHRVFVPVAYVPGWSPYRHGYWYWTAFGWTWYSFDPWGAITDHCGHWRHHRWYGWVWVPDPVCVWRPAVVTFFYGPLWIGWYPYDPGWSWGYWYGYEHGFDDGYWLGYAVGRAAGEGRAAPGFVATTYEDFCPGRPEEPGPGGGESGHAPRGPDETASHPARDLSGVRLADPVAANEAFNEAVRKGHVGPVPGGGSDPAAGWKFWARKTGIRPTEVPLKTTALHPGTGRWFEPVRPPADIPAKYREAAARIRTSTGAAAGAGRLRSVGVGQALDAPESRGGTRSRGVAPPPAEAPPRPAGPTVRPSEPSSAPSPAGPPSEETVRVPTRRDAPREYRVVPAAPPVAPARTPEATRPSVEEPARSAVPDGRWPVVTPSPHLAPVTPPPPPRVRENPPPSRPAPAEPPRSPTVAPPTRPAPASPPPAPRLREAPPSTPATKYPPAPDRIVRPGAAPESRSRAPMPAPTASPTRTSPGGVTTRPAPVPPVLKPAPSVRKFVPAIRNAEPERR